MNDYLRNLTAVIIKHLEGRQLTIAEQRELDEWLATSSKERELFSRLTNASYVREELAKFYTYDAEGGWRKIQAAHTLQTRTPVIRLTKRWKYWAAAVILAAIAITVLFTFYPSYKTIKSTDHIAQNRHGDIKAPTISKATITLQDGTRISVDSINAGTVLLEDKTAIQKTVDGQIVYAGDEASATKFNTLTNPRGSQVIQLTLSDGSKVWLNVDSEIKYPVVFVAGQREVEVTGEAYFEVAKNAAKPFVVKANGTAVLVTGTHFNVNAYKDETSVKVTLLEGGVKISKNNNTLSLLPGQQAQVSDIIKADKQVDIEQVMAWKNGTFIFKGTDIYTIMRQLSRWYDVDIHFEDSFTENFYGDISRSKDISNVLVMLEMTGEVHFKTKEKIIEVSK